MSTHSHSPGTGISRFLPFRSSTSNNNNTRSQRSNSSSSSNSSNSNIGVNGVCGASSNITGVSSVSNNSSSSLLNHLHHHHNHHNQNNSNKSPCDRLSFDVSVHENKNSKYRPTMEDVHTYVANFAERLDWGYFAVFDGHAGKQAARWCGSNLHSILVEKILKDDYLDLRINLNKAFLEADNLLVKNLNGSSGCTAAVAVIRWEEEIDDDSNNNNLTTPTLTSPINIIKNDSIPFDFIPTIKHKRMLYTANVGDTRIVLNRNGKAIRLSYDHKSSDKREQKRVIESGGLMLKNRVNGVLAVTRSLGDVYMKQSVIGSPFTTACEIGSNDDCIIIACDGLWDVCSDDKAVQLIKDVKDSDKAAKILVDYAMSLTTTDNVTCMVIKFDKRVFDYKNINTTDDSKNSI